MAKRQKSNLEEFETSFFAAIELVKIELLLHPELKVEDIIKRGSIASFDVAAWQKVALKRLIKGELSSSQAKAFCEIGLDKVKSVVKMANKEEVERKSVETISNPEQRQSQANSGRILRSQQCVDMIRHELETHPGLTIQDIQIKHRVNGEYHYYKIDGWNATNFLIYMKKRFEEGQLEPEIKTQLEEMGFDFKVMEYHTVEMAVQKIKKYLSEHPDKTIYSLLKASVYKYDKRVPLCKYIDGWNVSNWIVYAKTLLKQGAYSQEEIELLASVGITLNMPRKKSTEEEKALYRKSGRKGVPIEEGVQRIRQEMQEKGVVFKDFCTYQVKKPPYFIKDWNASSWIRNVQVRYREGKLTEKDVELLKTIGFFQSSKRRSKKPAHRRMSQEEISDIFKTLNINRYAGVNITTELRVKQIHEEFFAHPELTIDDMRARYDANGERIDYMIGDWNVSNWIGTMQAYLTQGGCSISEEVLLNSIGIFAIKPHKNPKKEEPPPKIEKSPYKRETWEGPAVPETAKPFYKSDIKIDK